MVDVRCQHCRTRFGFAHPAPSAPLCPKCRKPHDLTELEKLMGDLDEFEHQAPLSEAIANRIALGGTLDQIAALTGVGRSTLRSFLISASPLPGHLFRQACAAMGVEP